MARKRVKQTVIDQFSLRLYGESPRDVWIANALQPYGAGMLRAVMIESLYEGLHVLKKRGWNISIAQDEKKSVKNVMPKDSTGKTLVQPSDIIIAEPTTTGRSALDELMRDD